jgi:hypothetical protein
MGICGSTFYTSNKLFSENVKWQKTFDMIGMDPNEVKRLYSILCTISKSAELGYMLTEDFFTYGNIIYKYC